MRYANRKLNRPKLHPASCAWERSKRGRANINHNRDGCATFLTRAIPSRRSNNPKKFSCLFVWFVVKKNRLWTLVHAKSVRVVSWLKKRLWTFVHFRVPKSRNRLALNINLGYCKICPAGFETQWLSIAAASSTLFFPEWRVFERILQIVELVSFLNLARKVKDRSLLF